MADCWNTASIAVVGRSHERDCIPCQDKARSYHKNGVCTISLADGAGSSKFSDEGAELVVYHTNRYLTNHFQRLKTMSEQDIANEIIMHLKCEIQKHAVNREIELKEFASTLLFVAANDDHYIYGHLGDGMIFGKRKTSFSWDVLSEPQNGEYANQTYFVTQSNSELKCRIYKGSLDDLEGFLLVSDGSMESLYDVSNKRAAKAISIISSWFDSCSNRKVNRMIEDSMKSMIRMKTMDDCSLAIMKRKKKRK